MLEINIKFVLVAVISILVNSIGCVDFDSSSVRPTAVAPASTVVDAVSVPFDPKLPKYVVAVEPVQLSGTVINRYSAIQSARTGQQTPNMTSTTTTGTKEKQTGTANSNTTISESIRISNPDSQAIRIAAQLTTALSGVENLALRDLSVIRRTAEGFYTTHLGAGEVGPFIIHALVTEYNPEADIDKLKIRVLPGTKFERDHKVGAVVLDLSVIDGRDGHIVTSFPATGTFQWRKQKSEVGIIFSPYSAEKQAKSVMDNAMRAALNDGAKQILDKLSQSAQ